MATNKTPPLKVVALHGTAANGFRLEGPLRRTVRGATGEPTYTLVFAPGVPYLLAGEAEIAAVAKDIACGRLSELEISAGAIKQLAANAATRKLQQEIERLRGVIAELTPAPATAEPTC